MHPKYDVIIIGAGPSGASAACKLALHGLKTLVIDKERFPRYKICGGAVSYKTNKILNLDFSSVTDDVTEGIIFCSGTKRDFFIKHDSPIASMVMRDSFDNLLAEKSRDVGAEFLYGRKVNWTKEDNSSVVVGLEEQEIQAKVLIAADGASSAIARDYFKIPSKPNILTIEGEFSLDKERLAQLRGKVIIEFGGIPWGYGWIFPKGNVLSVGMAGLSTKINFGIKKYYDEFVERHEILNGLKPIREGGWFIPYFMGDRIKISSKRILLAGDAAHIVDSFIGEGIYYAIRSGQIAADAIIHGIEKDDFASYANEMEKEIYPELSAAQAIANMVYSHPKIWYNMLAASPDFVKRYYNVINGQSSYQTFLKEILSISRFGVLVKAVKGWVKLRSKKPVPEVLIEDDN